MTIPATRASWQYSRASGYRRDGQDTRRGPSAGWLTAAVSAQQRKRPRTLAELEAAYIAEMMVATGGNKTECARILGISRKNLYEKLARYKL